MGRGVVCALAVVGHLAGSVPATATGSAAVDAAESHVEKNHKALGLTGADVHDMVVSSVVPSRHNGVTHVYFEQRHKGVSVWTGVLTVSVAADGTVLSTAGRFVPNLAAAAAGQNPKRTAAEAAGAASGHVGLKPSKPFQVVSKKGTADEATVLTDGGVSAKPVEAKLVWLPAGGSVRLAWAVEIEEQGGDHWWIAFVDAQTGASLGQHDLVVHDSAQAIAEAIVHPGGAEGLVASFPPTDGAVYNVFPIPFESPTDGGRVLVTDVANPNASPFGWHDTDGAPGPEFTRTRGNNVHAYTDVDANNAADPGSDPDGGPALVFDFPFDPADQPPAYRPAAVTNLFYWNNVVHDVTYEYGFDEAGGNFQVNNYGKGGVGGDDVRAEAQDGSGTNNANFGTGVEGVRPRMQMFVWTHPFPNIVTVTSPGGIAGDYAASRAVFGPSFLTTGPISGTVTLANDGVGATDDACEPLVGFPAGDVALIFRGTCAFTIKVKNAQNAGATAVIMGNNVAGNPLTMGGTDPTITIPSLMVSQDNANLYVANLPVTATLRANPLTSINRDSDLDAGVIAHEYGHGISNRLTGGPAVIGCLSNAEQMGEGWSDWFAMVLTTHPSDTPTTARGVGSYLLFQPADGAGIRPTPYTTDTSVNPSTYASVANPAISQPHGIGYVWNTMLWDVYWNLVDRYGYNPNVYESWTTGGNNLAIQLVMDGMKFQPCLPGFVDGRDAILAADVALTGGVNRCEIWRGFAKRGLGFSASQGLSTNRFDGVEAFDLPAACTAAVFGGFTSPVDGPPAINTANAGASVPVKFTVSDPGAAWSIDSQPVDCVSLEITGEAPEPLASPGSTGLQQDGDEYRVNWKTDGSLANTCRKVTLRIPAATDAVAYFRFF